MTSRILTATRLLVVAGAATIVLAGCGGGDAGNGSPKATASATPDGQAAALNFAKCLRENGQPNFRDPVKNDQGAWDFPDAVGTVPDACADLARQAKSGGGQTQPKLTSDDMAKLRQFAACMRNAGVADFPDPRDDGTFLLTGQSASLLDKTRPAVPEQEECRKQLPAGLQPMFATS
ncbi:hypothetical protein ACFO1B_56200 [Dactylosporangium siamense]|uniref:Secreted protein n=1 Tax=Dactylosporangium siamense TaxID=685454 RepID=A0A919PYT9_9ACTN|nr:hypothetical protein [Dactylosporangium siamense]GIG53235.1 hypothetical protein Dsi01nite_112760 [Dactylosporangium siamense]